MSHDGGGRGGGGGGGEKDVGDGPVMHVCMYIDVCVYVDVNVRNGLLLQPHKGERQGQLRCEISPAATGTTSLLERRSYAQKRACLHVL